MDSIGPGTGDGTITLDDSTWDRLIELTGGAAGPCFQCGLCTATCPVGMVRDETFSVRRLIRRAQLGLSVADSDLWLCAACGQCEALCPRGVDVARTLRGLRNLAWEQRQAPPGLPSVLWSLYWNNNPWSQPPSGRSRWSHQLAIPRFDPGEHELLLFVGCTPSYDRRAGRIAAGLVRLLRAAGVSFGFLGDDEPCCGDAAFSLGHEPFFRERSWQAAEYLAEQGVKRMVTVSPHCYDIFKNHLPGGANGLQVCHYSRYLAELLQVGRLPLKNAVAVRAAFHDPCFLARHNAETRAPRSILEAVPGIELVEMAHNREDTICCGGGGGRMWLEIEAGQRFAALRVQEALAVGATVLVTACPFCVACLEEASAGRQDGLQILDVAEIAVLALDEEPK